MAEQLEQNHQFKISSAQLDDAVGIGRAHLQSWLETYPNEGYGITKEWISEEFAFLTDSKGVRFREDVINNLDHNTKYMVVKDEDDVIQGFLHASKTDTVASLNAIYLTDPLKGTGVADKLMNAVLEFAENLPIQLQVVAYNERAIRFYEKYGFKRGKEEAEWFHGKIPILNMKKEVTREV